MIALNKNISTKLIFKLFLSVFMSYKIDSLLRTFVFRTEQDIQTFNFSMLLLLFFIREC